MGQMRGWLDRVILLPCRNDLGQPADSAARLNFDYEQLLRALEPLDGIDRMERLRGGAGLLDLARGPGRLAQALQIDFKQDGLDLCAAGPLWLGTSRCKTGSIGKSVRIGLTRDVGQKLRFYEEGNPYVSGPKRLSG
jgi:DNA-3-methyladenine glycosylase